MEFPTDDIPPADIPSKFDTDAIRSRLTESLESLSTAEIYGWPVDIALLRDRIFEAKYPNKTIDQSNIYSNFLITVLGDPAISIDDAVKKFQEDSRFTNKEIPLPHPISQYEEYFNSYGVDIASTLQETENGVCQVIRDLDLPSHIEALLIDRIQNTNIVLTAFTKIGSNADALDRLVTVDLAQVFRVTQHVSLLTGQPMSEKFLKSMLVGITAHELGHSIDSTMMKPYDHVYSSSNLPTESSFPIQYDDSHTKREVWSERFAMFVSYATLDLLGLSKEALEDAKRLDVSEFMMVAKNISQDRLSQFRYALPYEMVELDLSKIMMGEIITHTEEEMRIQTPVKIMREYMNIFVSGHAVGQAFPFTKEQVKDALLQQPKHLLR